ncbi:hypothetical protein CYMTET_23462 [Cymbomonas tetramitiformis]|uniref:Tubulin--tyrosine ligase-like protein 9 n=1 Tax=Cymbomonas tetramitiformis TaxID=36881 RepID=A0AAE0L188_9CHLO|nr:hypothetical protein CYMTET_23462 [Cymbomonas tetramitiformis]
MEKRARPLSARGGAAGRQRDAGLVRFRSSLHNTIYEVMKERPGWMETDSELDWDIFWADTGWVHDHIAHVHLLDHQRINHFPNHYELTRKDLLVKNLKRAKRNCEREARLVEAAQYDFFPATYTLPSEYNLFVEEFKRTGGIWIMKPVGRAQGRGIFLVHKLSQLAPCPGPALFLHMMSVCAYEDEALTVVSSPCSAQRV